MLRQSTQNMTPLNGVEMTTMDDLSPQADFVTDPSGTGGPSPQDINYVGDEANADLNALGEASKAGTDLGAVGDVGDDLNSDNIGISDIAQGLDDLASGNLDGAAGEGVTIGLDAALAAGGLPGVDGVNNMVSDFLSDNWTKFGSDAEDTAIQTGASIALGAAGSALGPVGTAVGSALGEFVGGAIAPAVEDVASDTYNTVDDVINDTATEFGDAGTDVADGNYLDAAGAVATGVGDDIGDVATGAYDLAGDGLEAVGDLATATVSAVEDLPSDLEDIGDSAVDDVEDVGTDIGEGVEDVASDLEDLF